MKRLINILKVIILIEIITIFILLTINLIGGTL
jgi:hypothetical protein